jgi:hypothetical protein
MSDRLKLIREDRIDKTADTAASGQTRLGVADLVVPAVAVMAPAV